jgi:hypothetical protein
MPELDAKAFEAALAAYYDAITAGRNRQAVEAAVIAYLRVLVADRTIGPIDTSAPALPGQLGMEGV